MNLRLRESLIGACFAFILFGRGPIAAPQTPSQHADSSLAVQFRQALSLAEHGEKQRAMALTTELLERNASFVPAIKLKGMLLEEDGDASQAGAVYEQGLSLAPNDPDLLLKTGIYRLAEGDRERAIELLRHCVKISPHDGDAQYYLAQAYHLNGQDKLALAAIRQSLKAEPDNASVWQKYGGLLCDTGDCDAGLHWLLKAQRKDASLPRIDFDIAAIDYKLMDLAGAAQHAARAVEVQPSDVGALELLATSDVKLAQWKEAEPAFQRILALRPGDVDALLGLGQCQVELKKYQAGVETLRSVLHLDPARLLVHFYLSRAYAGMGNTEDAQHEAELHQLMMEQATFVRSTSNEQRESVIKPKAETMLAAHEEDAALRLYQQHFKGSSATFADAYVFVGKLYLFTGKTEDGVRCLHYALKLQPTVRGAHTYEGILELKDGDLNRAESEFEAELANDPSYQMAIAELGEVRYHQQRWAEASEQLAKSKTMTPELLYMLCDSYFHLGKVKDARLNAEAMAAYARNKPNVMKGLIELLVRNGQSDLAKRLESQ